MIEKQVSMLERLPGFNDVGVSLLARSLPCCTNPGELVKSLPNLANRLSSSNDPDISWVVWIDSLFEENSSSPNSRKALQDLRNLVEAANNIELAMADVVMMSQIYDCAIELGINLNSNP